MFRDEATLADILTTTRRFEEFIVGIDRPAFLNEVEKQSAVLHQLLILGEAARRLSPALRATNAPIPWSDVIAMRNRLIHGYDRVDLDVVWSTASNDVPRLREHVADLLAAD